MARVTLRLPDGRLEALRGEARERGISLSSLVVEKFEQYIDRWEAERDAAGRPSKAKD
jgi:hypothetical protein